MAFCFLCFHFLKLTQVELSDGSWKEIERVEKSIDEMFIQKEKDAALEDTPKVVINNTDANKENKDAINTPEPSGTNGTINKQTNGNSKEPEKKVCFFFVGKRNK